LGQLQSVRDTQICAGVLVPCPLISLSIHSVDRLLRFRFAQGASFVHRAVLRLRQVFGPRNNLLHESIRGFSCRSSRLALNRSHRRITNEAIVSYVRQNALVAHVPGQASLATAPCPGWHFDKATDAAAVLLFGLILSF
jgi:hypothetical protein